MNDSIQGLLVFIGLSVGSAFIVHLWKKKIVFGAFISAPIATISFLTVSALKEDSIDSFWPIALIVGIFVSFVISLGVGVLVSIGRKWPRHSVQPKDPIEPARPTSK